MTPQEQNKKTLKPQVDGYKLFLKYLASLEGCRVYNCETFESGEIKWGKFIPDPKTS